MRKESTSPVLFIADPLHALKIASDTSLAFAEGALSLGRSVYWCEPQDVSVFGTEIRIQHPTRLISVSTAEVKHERCTQPLPLSFFSHAFVRKDPPFNDNYRDLCWMLASQHTTRIANAAEALLSFHEKAVQWRAASEGFLGEDNLISTCVSADPQLLLEFAHSEIKKQNSTEASARFVLKPWLGHGGEDVHLLKSFSELEAHLKKLGTTPQGALQEKQMLQPFLPEIHSEGDRRVLIVCGKVIGDFVRFPASGRIESNLAQGGRAEVVPMNASQLALMESLGQFLVKHDIGFAGADLIGNRVSEVNITSPTGIRTVEKFNGCALAAKVMESLLEF